jgi:hypothetical protein
MAIQPDPRPAIPADRPAIEEIVRDAYSPYIDRVGRQPGPMLDDYEALIRAGRVYVAITRLQHYVAGLCRPSGSFSCARDECLTEMEYLRVPQCFGREAVRLAKDV